MKSVRLLSRLILASCLIVPICSFSQKNEIEKNYDLISEGKVDEAINNYQFIIQNRKPPYSLDLLMLGLKIYTYSLDDTLLNKVIEETKYFLEDYSQLEKLKLKFIEAVILEQKGDYKSSLNLYLEILSENQVNKNDYLSIDLQIDVLANIGLINKSSGNYRESLINHNQAIDIAKTKQDTTELIRLLGNRGTVFLSLDSIELAQKDLIQSLNFSQKMNDSISITRNLFNLSNIQIHKGDYDEAILILDDLYKRISTISRPRLMVLTNMGLAYKKKGEYSSAITFLKQVENDSSFNLDKNIQISVYKNLYDSYKEKNDTINSLLYLTRYSTIIDSTLNVELTNDLLNLQKDFYNKYTLLEIDNLRLNNQNLRLRFYVFLILGILSILVFLYKRDKNKYDYFLYSKLIRRSYRKQEMDLKSQEILKNAKQFLKREGYKDQSLDLNKCSRLIGTNKDYLSKSIAQSDYKDFHQMVNRIRSQKVVDKILNSKDELSIDDLMSEFGFSNRGTFYKYFKEETGLTPKRFINLNKSKN